MKDLIIWAILFLLLLIICGLYIGEYTDINYKNKVITENFNNPDHSTMQSQKEGASPSYNWGVPANKMHNMNDHDYHPNKDNSCHHTCNKDCPISCPNKCKMDSYKEKSKEENKCGHTCNYSCPNPCPHSCNSNRPPHEYDQRFLNNDNIYKEKVYLNTNCYTCDITTNKDIDKYILKSSVPACPDMSEFITKNMMNASPDLSDYILKSEVKACETIDHSKYILKSHIPKCHKCQKEKHIKDFDIRHHPDIRKYIKRDDLTKYYKLKDEYKHAKVDVDPYYHHVTSTVLPTGEDLEHQLRDMPEDRKEDLAKDIYNTFSINQKKDLVKKFTDILGEEHRQEVVNKITGQLTEKDMNELKDKLFHSNLSKYEKKDISHKLNHEIQKEKEKEIQECKKEVKNDMHHRKQECKKYEKEKEWEKQIYEKEKKKKEEERKKKPGFLDSIFDSHMSSNLLGNVKGYYAGDNIYEEY
jgi:hypothetical protein